MERDVTSGSASGDRHPTGAIEFGADIESALCSARELLGMEIAWIAEFRDGMKVFRSIEGDGDSFGFSREAELPLDTSYCRRLTLGDIPNAIPDTAKEDRVRDLDITASARIGSYAGVPIALADGTIYGTLCVASHHPRGEIGERDIEFLSLLGRRVAERVEEQRSAGRASHSR